MALERYVPARLPVIPVSSEMAPFGMGDEVARFLGQSEAQTMVERAAMWTGVCGALFGQEDLGRNVLSGLADMWTGQDFLGIGRATSVLWSLALNAAAPGGEPGLGRGGCHASRIGARSFLTHGGPPSPWG